MKQHLLYKNGSVDRFWKIEVTGNSYQVTSGKSGTRGSSRTKTFKDKETCLEEARRLVNEKMNKGYREVKTSSRAKISAKKHDAVADEERDSYYELLNSTTKEKLQAALCNHFSYLADTPGFEVVLSALMREAKEVKVKKGDLLIIFHDKTVLTAKAPNDKNDYRDYPKSYQKLMSYHSSIAIEYPVNCSLYPSNSYRDDGWICEDIEEYDDVKTAIDIESDLFVYHPEKKNSFGEPALCFVDHEDGSLGEFEEMNAGSLFLIKLCEILKIKVDIPKIRSSKRSFKKESASKEITVDAENVQPGKLTLSAELSELLGAKKLTRSEAVSKLFSYIQNNRLMDSKTNKIIADEKLKKIFGEKETATMFELAAIVNKHLK